MLLAIWIAVVIAILCAIRQWWGLVFVIPWILNAYLIRRILVARPGR